MEKYKGEILFSTPDLLAGLRFVEFWWTGRQDQNISKSTDPKWWDLKEIPKQ